MPFPKGKRAPYPLLSEPFRINEFILKKKKKIFSEQMFSNKFKTFHEVFFIIDMLHDLKESYF